MQSYKKIKKGCKALWNVLYCPCTPAYERLVKSGESGQDNIGGDRMLPYHNDRYG